MDEITIFPSFYEMDVWGQGLYESDDEENLQRSIKVIDDRMNRKNWIVKYIWSNLSEKINNLENNYEVFMGKIRRKLQLSKEIPEETVILNIIKHYQKILHDKDCQLQIFEDIYLTKKIADCFTYQLIGFFKGRLEMINPASLDVIENLEKKDSPEMIYELPSDFSLQSRETNQDASLDIRQSAILFYLLRKHKAIIPYSDASLAKFVHYLTGYSESNLRTRKGLGNYWSIIKENREGISNYNAIKVKEFLETVLEDLEKQL